jgi:hypothetical protein
MAPPRIQNNPYMTLTWRFVCTEAGEYQLEEGMILQAFGAICTITNSSCSLFANSYKIHKVSVWAPGPSTSSLEWTSGAGNSRGKQLSGTSLSTANPSYVSGKPPPGSSLSFERSNGTSVVLILDLVQDAVVDIHATCWLQDGGQAFTRSITAGTAGLTYYFALDATGNKIQPVERETTN